MSVREIRKYGFVPFADFYIQKKDFVIEINDADLAETEKCVYIFTVGNSILRIGSSKAKLKTRMRRFEIDITKSLNQQKSNAPLWEGKKWRDRLKAKKGVIYARQGAMVKTPIGRFSAYLDEESILLGKFQNLLNRNKHR